MWNTLSNNAKEVGKTKNLFLSSPLCPLTLIGACFILEFSINSHVILHLAFLNITDYFAPCNLYVYYKK